MDIYEDNYFSDEVNAELTDVDEVSDSSIGLNATFRGAKTAQNSLL